MYRQGYLDQARVRNQYAYYPSPNFAAMSGFAELKQLPTAFYDGLKEMKMTQVVGAAGMVAIAASFVVGKKKVSKKIPVQRNHALAAVGTVATAISLYMTYQEL